ncbi:uncharacterized protein [Apostichopus japonicus]|uniref:uncharacterized protein n=1 Tax=Stichopus japonicus TaxID=307972 RepID=UPI003AB5AFA4
MVIIKHSTTVTQYPNNKPWCDKVIKAKLKAKDEAYRTKTTDPDLYHRAKSDLRKAIKKAKRAQKDRIEQKFQTANSREVWANIEAITQYKGVKRSVNTDDAALPDKLNEFYARFDRGNSNQPIPVNNGHATAPFNSDITLVNYKFKRLNERKAAGPDGITPKLLKMCAEQLAEVYTNIFNWSLSLCEVPRSFKDAIIVPEKKRNVSCLILVEHFKLLEHLNFPASICDWILDFLLCRKQTVRVGNIHSASIVLNTGTPQGCLLSPLLYSLLTYDCRAADQNSRIIKFADDTTVTGLIINEDESGYLDEVDLLAKWCTNNNLILNVNKTKELIVDSRRNKKKGPYFDKWICCGTDKCI